MRQSAIARLSALFVTVCWAWTAAPAAAVERRAILIGINDYADLVDLKYACADQVQLKARLLECGFPEDRIFLLHDDATDIRLRPTQRNIDRQLGVVLNLAAPEDLENRDVVAQEVPKDFREFAAKFGQCRALIEKAKLSTSATARAALLADARSLIDEALVGFQHNERIHAARLRVHVTDAKRQEEMLKTQGDYIQMLMFGAYGLKILAETFDASLAAEVPAWQGAMRAAAEKYGTIYKEYRTLVSGIAARLEEARCYQALGELQRAVDIYREFALQPDFDVVRPYKACATYLMQQCRIGDELKQYEQAAVEGEAFLALGRPEDLTKPEWLAVRYFTGEAYRLWSSQLDQADPQANVAQMTKCLERMQAHGKFVTEHPGEYQELAKKLLR